MKTRVSIVDDDEPTRKILIEVIGCVPTLQYVSDYGSSAVALRQLLADRPDVVLMDINMPEPNGVECVRVLKRQMPGTQFLMLTVYQSAEHVFAALAAGATGYLLKETRREELVAAIEQIALGGSPMTSAIARKVVQSFAQPGSARPTFEDLTPRERQVLECLSQGYLYKEIADTMGIGVPTVATHIRKIYEKLHVRSRSQAIAKYLGHPATGG
ncbi:response regulator transcription factor [Opitutus sp. ER46]|uniref:response regulator n=1 Tax=Opitutus sp. ER46 TaxID=2161864 RepID=UPI000D3039A0|nr:response regulator transcription factor [Opitutus sp. ER46]PTX92294.1 DNA-binding response regulator [Opitutus sp. ER46]